VFHHSAQRFRFAVQQTGVVDAVAVFVKKEIHASVVHEHALMQAFEKIVHAVAVLVKKAFHRAATLFKNVPKTVTFQTARAVLLAGDIVDIVAVEIDNIIDIAVSVAVEVAPVKIIDAVAVAVSEKIVTAVFVFVDEGEMVPIGSQTDIIDTVAVTVAEKIVAAVFVFVDVADNFGGGRLFLLGVQSGRWQDEGD
jgi:hypothetical protein